MKRSLIACLAACSLGVSAQTETSHSKTVISVRTAVPGASADVVEAEVTFPLERALLRISSIQLLRTASRSELSVIEIATDRNRACDGLADTVAALRKARSGLPAQIVEPLVTVSPELKCP